MNMQINTYGNVETLYYVFNGVAAFMHSNSFSGMVRFTLLGGLLIALFASIGRKSTDVVKWFMSALIVAELLIAPVENVFITDMTNTQPTREVDHVPVYLAAIAQAGTLVSTALTAAYETVFSIPDTLGLRKGDVGFGDQVLQKVNQAEITDPGLHADLMQFFKECTVYDIQDGAIDPRTIMSGADVWQTVLTQTSPARYVTTNTLTPNPTTDTCQAIGTLLLIRIQDAEQAAEQMYGSEMFPEIADPSAARADFVNAIGDSYGVILQSSQNASSALRQAMFNNLWRQAGAELPAMLNDPARVDEVNALLSSAQAAVAANGSMQTVGILAQRTLPTVRNYIEAIVYTLFPIVFVLCLIGGGEAAKKILGGYGKTIAWIGLWPVLFAVLNGLSMIHLRYVSRSMSLGAGVPFGISAKYGASLINEQALLGYMIITVPLLAWGVLHLASTGVAGAFSRITDGITGPGQQIGGQQAQGDENIGNVHMDSASVANTTENVMQKSKYDTSQVWKAGSQTMDSGTGSVFTNYDSGPIVRSDAQNSLGFAANASTTSEQLLGTHASSGLAANATKSSFSGAERLAQGTTSLGQAQEKGKTQRSGDDASNATRAAQTQSGDHRQGDEQSYASDQEHRSQGQTDVGGNAGIKIEAGAGKSFGEGNPVSSKPASGGANSPGEPSAYNAATEESLAKKAQGLGKSPQEVQENRDAYRRRSAAADMVAGRGQGRGGASASFGFELGGSVGHTQSYINSDAEKFVNQYTNAEGYVDSNQVTQEAAKTHNDSTGMESGQRARNDQSASLTDQTMAGSRESADLTHSADLRQLASTQTVSRVDETRNLLTPDNLKAVAARNGMRYSQFMTLPESEMRRLVQDDAAMRELMQTVRKLPPKALDGSALPTNPNDVVKQHRVDQRRTGGDVDSAWQRAQSQVGPVDTTPLDVKTDEPQLIADTRARVETTQQRVAGDASVPVKRVTDKVDVPDEVKPLMSPEHAPGRPLSPAHPVGMPHGHMPASADTVPQLPDSLRIGGATGSGNTANPMLPGGLSGFTDPIGTAGVGLPTSSPAVNPGPGPSNVVKPPLPQQSGASTPSSQGGSGSEVGRAPAPVTPKPAQGASTAAQRPGAAASSTAPTGHGATSSSGHPSTSVQQATSSLGGHTTDQPPAASTRAHDPASSRSASQPMRNPLAPHSPDASRNEVSDKTGAEPKSPTGTKPSSGERR
ncbi:conjugal transfer protein TraG N-terminal domain-containing protein [Burkholderia glumae]|uniref:conjugal transfer protein TraG N-terminal domain-containing protein n=1 Tax=Burkholderia glumae TaxID=337 RepID=UPI002151E6A4|nr:conjugal transfer protein TraG N-terminal domain-containing protein [Burkholderia glumae]